MQRLGPKSAPKHQQKEEEEEEEANVAPVCVSTAARLISATAALYVAP